MSITLYIDPSHTPARILSKASTGLSLLDVKANSFHTLSLKRADQLPIKLVILNCDNASSIRIGTKQTGANAAENPQLLLLGESAEVDIKSSTSTFELLLTVNTEALKAAFEAQDSDLYHLHALSEITWTETYYDSSLNPVSITRVSENLPTVIYNDIIKAAESIPAIDSNYPVAEAIATKDWVQQEQSAQDTQFADQLHTALYSTETCTISSRTGNDNISCDWLQIAPKNISAGQLQQIRIKCRSNSSAPIETALIYLHIWEKQSDGSYAKLATSTNAITQALSQWSIWNFEPATLSGRTLRLYASTNPTESTWGESYASLGTRCIARSADDSDSLINTLGATGDINYEAETQFTIIQTLPHFADRNTAALINAHTSAYHATQDELNAIRDRLTALENNPAQNLPSWAQSIEGNATGISLIRLADNAQITSRIPEGNFSGISLLSYSGLESEYYPHGGTLSLGNNEVNSIELLSQSDCRINGSSVQSLFDNQGNSAALPAWANCIEGSAEGISEIKLYRTASITSSNSNYSNSRVEILSTNTAVSTLGTSLTLGDSEKVEEIELKSSQSCHIEAPSQIALVSGELQVDATAINYLNAGNEAYPAWLDTVEGDTEGISQLILKPNGAGISTTPTASHSLGVPLLQYIRPYSAEHETHMYLGAHSLEIMRLSTTAGDVYQGEIKPLLS